jgi:hypothetical protein
MRDEIFDWVFYRLLRYPGAAILVMGFIAVLFDTADAVRGRHGSRRA